jgi:hypothetical protein
MENTSINSSQNALVKCTLNPEEYSMKYLTSSKNKACKNLKNQFKKSLKK